MITETSLTNHGIATQIHALAQIAYALEAVIIGCADFPPLRESLAELHQSPDRFLICHQGDTACSPIIGALAFAPDVDADSTAITGLVVSPAHLRQGIATALHAEFQQRLPPAIRRITVSTAQANRPAVLLYQKLGYVIASSTISAEGITLLHFSRCRDRED